MKNMVYRRNNGRFVARKERNRRAKCADKMAIVNTMYNHGVKRKTNMDENNNQTQWQCHQVTKFNVTLRSTSTNLEVHRKSETLSVSNNGSLSPRDRVTCMRSNVISSRPNTDTDRSASEGLNVAANTDLPMPVSDRPRPSSDDMPDSEPSSANTRSSMNVEFEFSQSHLLELPTVDRPTHGHDRITMSSEAASLQLTGRRIVELDTLANELSVCQICNLDGLRLSNIISETRRGFGSYFYIKCTYCAQINQIKTGKTHCPTPNEIAVDQEKHKTGERVFDINTKAALGMYHTGMGASHVESFMSVLEIPSITDKHMKHREKEVTPVVKHVARQSCDEALKEEIVSAQKFDTHKSCMESGLEHNPDEGSNDEEISYNESKELSVQHKPASVAQGGIAVKYDMGWQKRGSGRCYNSATGVGTMMGNITNKIINYGVKSKHCKTCSHYQSKKLPTPAHTCGRNWGASSKSMEPAVALELVLDIEQKGTLVDVLIMDDDATTLARIRSTLSHDIKKWSDINHTKKHLGNSLYTLQKKHKQLSTTVIKYLQKMFAYAIAQNKENVQNTKHAISQIVPHCFGNHAICGQWCGYHKNAQDYKHSSLPYGKDLCGESLQRDLEAIFQVFLNNAEKISPCASTREVESFNNSVASKVPKARHYAASESIYARVGCAVAQRNTGLGYITDVNNNLQLSPGKFYSKYALKSDKKRKQRLEREQCIEFKRRKLEQKLTEVQKRNTSEIREGTTYSSGCALTHASSIEEIPQAVAVPEKIPLEHSNYIFIYFDIETSSLGEAADITQISAIAQNNSFDTYVLPTGPINPRAAEITGLSYSNGRLYLHGSPVDAVTTQIALQNFVIWLKDMSSSVLVGHNVGFDSRHLVRALKSYSMRDVFEQNVAGFADTLPLMRELYPKRTTYKQEELVKDLLKTEYGAHNSLEDVKALKDLMKHTNAENKLLKYSFSSTYAFDISKYRKTGTSNINSYSKAISAKAISKSMAEKAARSGLRLEHMELAEQRGGREAVAQLLSEMVQEKPRVSKDKKVVSKLCDYIAKLSAN